MDTDSNSPAGSFNYNKVLKYSIYEFLIDMSFWGAGYLAGYMLLNEKSIMDNQVLAGIFLIIGYIGQILYQKISYGLKYAEHHDPNGAAITGNPEIIILYIGVAMWMASIFIGIYNLDGDMITGVPEWQAFVMIFILNFFYALIKEYKYYY